MSQAGTHRIVSVIVARRLARDAPVLNGELHHRALIELAHRGASTAPATVWRSPAPAAAPAALRRSIS